MNKNRQYYETLMILYKNNIVSSRNKEILDWFLDSEWFDLRNEVDSLIILCKTFGIEFEKDMIYGMLDCNIELKNPVLMKTLGNVLESQVLKINEHVVEKLIKSMRGCWEDRVESCWSLLEEFDLRLHNRFNSLDDYLKYTDNKRNITKYFLWANGDVHTISIKFNLLGNRIVDSTLREMTLYKKKSKELGIKRFKASDPLDKQCIDVLNCYDKSRKRQLIIGEEMYRSCADFDKLETEISLNDIDIMLINM